METSTLHLCRSVLASSFTQSGLVVIDSTPTIYTYDYNAIFECHANLDGFTSYIHRYDHNLSLSSCGKYALLSDPQKGRILLIDSTKKKLLANIKYSKSPNFSLFSAEGPFRILCQSGKITNTQGHRYEDRNRRRAICSRY